MPNQRRRRPRRVAPPVIPESSRTRLPTQLNSAAHGSWVEEQLIVQKRLSGARSSNRRSQRPVRAGVRRLGARRPPWRWAPAPARSARPATAIRWSRSTAPSSRSTTPPTRWSCDRSRSPIGTSSRGPIKERAVPANVLRNLPPPPLHPCERKALQRRLVKASDVRAGRPTRFFVSYSKRIGPGRHGSTSPRGSTWTSPSQVRRIFGQDPGGVWASIRAGPYSGVAPLLRPLNGCRDTGGAAREMASDHVQQPSGTRACLDDTDGAGLSRGWA